MKDMVPDPNLLPPEPMLASQQLQAPVYPTGEAVADPRELRADSLSRLSDTVRQAPATYVLLTINIGVFLFMFVRGVRFSSASDLLRFGANNTSYVLQGEWWRLVTAMFVHGGVVHLATNMWCLWNLGLLGEPLLGAFGIFSVYLLTGAAGNLLSIAASVLSELLNGTAVGSLLQWTGASMGEVGAGASGAVFGIAGMLIVLLSNRQLAQPRNGHPGIPVVELQRLRRSVVWFAAINLCIGAASIAMPVVRIDNMAHVGGVVCGLAMGLPLLPRMTSGRSAYLDRQRVTFALSGLLLLLVGVWLSKLQG